MERKFRAQKAFPLALCLLLCFLVRNSSWPAAATVTERITPVYDLFIGFTASGDCSPLRVQFRKLSVETVFRDLRFKFSPVTIGTKTYDWTIASLNSPLLLMSIAGIKGEGTISDHDLCPTWDTDANGKPLKATLAELKAKIKPLVWPLPRQKIPPIQGKILSNIPKSASDPDLVPLVPFSPYVLEFTTNIEPGASKITLEGSDAELRLTDIRCYAELPVTDLLAGKDISQEYSYEHHQVGNPGTLTIRFIPAKKKP
jgi:hypothetical protein